MENVLAILMAGGVGERLHPLTRDMAKPAVPFGGIYRLIDFTLSNCLNSGLRRILILTQYKALDLNRHIRDGWNILSPELGEYIEVLPPMKRLRDDWYLGTADSVFQNLESIVAEGPEFVLVLAADHIYKMNYQEMVDCHREYEAQVTIASLQVDPSEAPRFGILELGNDCRVTGFEEKPQHGNPVRSAFNPDMVSASMGIYLFHTEVLLEALRHDFEDPDSGHDFGHDVLPRCIREYRAVAYDFRDLNDKTARYWRDVGTIDAYYEANLDLVKVVPEFNLYDSRWPVRTLMPQQPPAKFVFVEEGRRMGVALDSIVSAGCIVSGGRVVNSILSPGVRVNSFCEVENSILLDHVNVGRGSRLRRTIVAPRVRISEGTVIGYNAAKDLEAGYYVSEGGVVVVPSPEHL